MNERVRPDPDALVERLRHEESRAARGRLRIYFGASAGVGKTYAMLLAARALRTEGRDVVAGIIETHGRADTAAQLAGFETLPKRVVAREGARPPEAFDLDAALVRRPALILVDELAHSNAAGSRHPKRWQDVDELLAAGIDVWTTLNVQHLDSLNDVVGGITGIRVQETLPDTFFDRADEVVLVDTPADELLARLRAGKVYGKAQAERAAVNFFRKGNLMALRELALRRTADRVEDDVQTYRIDRSIERVWKTEAALLCCVGPGAQGEHVVRSAALLAQQLAVSWHAVYVETPALQRLPEARRSGVLGTLKLAEELGATTAVLPHRSAAAAVVEYARLHNLSKMALGHARARAWKPGGTLAQRLGRLAADVDLVEFGAAAAARGGPAAPPEATGAVPVPRRPRIAGYAAALAACALLSAVADPLAGRLDKANVVMVFLLAVVGVALRYGRGPAVLAAFVNVAAFDYFIVPPRFSFSVDDVQYLLTFAVMLAVGLLVGQLTAGLRFQARIATHREQRSRALFELARELSGELVTGEIVATAARAIAREFHARVEVYVLADDDRLVPAGTAGAAGGAGAARDDRAGSETPSDASVTSRRAGGAVVDPAMPRPERAPEAPDPGTARWAFDHRRAAGLGTDTIPGSAWLYLPLNASMRTRGVLALQPESPRLHGVPELRRHLDTFAALTAIALERVHYVEVAQRATVQIESERLRNALLSALSHDLRTPLAGLAALADSLQWTEPPLAGAQREIAQELQASALRMNAQVVNLLEMARMESGLFRIAPGWNSIEELIGSAIRLTGPGLGTRTLRTDVPTDLPLVECDATFIERVLVNLLENAAKYTPEHAAIEIVARRRAEALEVCVGDDGPGIAPGQELAIFDKFTRGVRESATPGVGLGLAICKAIVEAHGGTIRAANRHAGRGAVFTFTLPLTEAPAVADDTLDAAGTS